MPFKSADDRREHYRRWSRGNKELKEKKSRWHAANRDRRLSDMTHRNHTKTLPEFHAKQAELEALKLGAALVALVNDDDDTLRGPTVLELPVQTKRHA